MDQKFRMWFRQAKFFSSTAALLAILAWFAGTQHCLLLGLTGGHDPAATTTCHCPDHPKAPGCPTDGPSPMLSCCQGLISPNLELDQAKLKFAPVLVWLQPPAIVQVLRLAALQPARLSTEYDHGPPTESWFIGTVLKRSLAENAPPVIA